MKLSDRASFLVDNLDLPAASGVDGAKWEYFQLAHLSDDSTLRIECKSRQIAWSFTVAAEAIAEAMLDGAGTIFVSINQEEAAEKIRYARRVFENLRISGLPKRTRDNELSLEFENGQIRVTIVPKGNVKATLKLASSAPVTEPALNLLVEFSWRGNRILQKYAVLLDPPR